jgi:hypothetical protein
MKITDEELRQHAMDTRRPLPGESLTNNPDTPAPYEGPPQYTTREEAIDYFLESILEERTFASIMNTLEKGIPVMDIVQVFLTNAFEEGIVNPDLMLLLAEPLAYILLGLAEREGIRAKIVTDSDDPEDPDDPDNWNHGEDDDDEMEEALPSQNILRDKLGTIKNPKNDKDLNLDKIIENAPSLMARGG